MGLTIKPMPTVRAPFDEQQQAALDWLKKGLVFVPYLGTDHVPAALLDFAMVRKDQITPPPRRVDEKRKGKR